MAAPTCSCNIKNNGISCLEYSFPIVEPHNLKSVITGILSIRRQTEDVLNNLVEQEKLLKGSSVAHEKFLDLNNEEDDEEIFEDDEEVEDSTILTYLSSPPP